MMRKRHEILPTETPRSESNPPVILGVRGRGEEGKLDTNVARKLDYLYLSIYLSIYQSINSNMYM